MGWEKKRSGSIACPDCQKSDATCSTMATKKTYFSNIYRTYLFFCLFLSFITLVYFLFYFILHFAFLCLFLFNVSVQLAYVCCGMALFILLLLVLLLSPRYNVAACVVVVTTELLSLQDEEAVRTLGGWMSTRRKTRMPYATLASKASLKVNTFSFSL